jgi:hypothetical protein
MGWWRFMERIVSSVLVDKSESTIPIIPNFITTEDQIEVVMEKTFTETRRYTRVGLNAEIDVLNKNKDVYIEYYNKKLDELMYLLGKLDTLIANKKGGVLNAEL